jgi:hypothetical protein
MKCRRAFETDLLAVLRGEGGDLEFLAHYPTCADCAAELRVWGELDAMLRAGVPAPAAHPSEEALLAFVDAPATLAADARAEVERHLAVCRTCADEVGSLRHFEPSQVDAPVAQVAPPVRADVPPRPPADHASDRGWLGRLVWHPAFAYALVVALLVPLVRSNLERLSAPAQFSESERVSKTTPRVAPGGAAVDQPAAVGAVAPAAPPEPAAAQPARPEDEMRARETLSASGLDRKNDDDRADLAMRKQASPDAAVVKPRVAEKKAESASENAVEPPALADRAAPAQEAAKIWTAPSGAAGSALTPLVELRADMPTTIPFAVAIRGPLLRIATPAALGERPIDVRVRGGGRELTRRIASRANAIALQIPPEWLAAGDYTVTLTPVASPPAAHAEGDFAAVAPLTFGFAVQENAR